MFISQTICNHFLHFFVRSLNFYWQSYPLSHDTAKLSIPECVQEFLQRLSAAVCCPLRFKFKCKQLLFCASKHTSKKKKTWRSRSSKHTRSRRLKPTPLSFSLLLPQQLSSLFSPSPTPRSRRLFIVRCKI